MRETTLSAFLLCFCAQVSFISATATCRINCAAFDDESTCESSGCEWTQECKSQCSKATGEKAYLCEGEYANACYAQDGDDLYTIESPPCYSFSPDKCSNLAGDECTGGCELVTTPQSSCVQKGYVDCSKITSIAECQQHDDVCNVNLSEYCAPDIQGQSACDTLTPEQCGEYNQNPYWNICMLSDSGDSCEYIGLGAAINCVIFISYADQEWGMPCNDGCYHPLESCTQKKPELPMCPPIKLSATINGSISDSSAGEKRTKQGEIDSQVVSAAAAAQNQVITPKKDFISSLSESASLLMSGRGRRSTNSYRYDAIFQNIYSLAFMEAIGQELENRKLSDDYHIISVEVSEKYIVPTGTNCLFFSLTNVQYTR